MIETVITIKFKTTKEQFEAKEFQDVINSIKTGEMSREFMKDGDVSQAACTVWTNSKQFKQ